MEERVKAMRNVITIEPYKPDLKRFRVAAYCRVSSSSEDQLHSFNAQFTHYSKITALDPDSELIEVYADEGITGTSIDKRNDFIRMLYDAKNKRFNRLLVKSVTRFGRNVVDSLNALRELNSNGVSVLFEEEHLDTLVIQGELLETLLCALAQEESEKKSADMKRAYRMRADLGIYHPNAAPTGFKIENKKLAVFEPEAIVKTFIKNEYLHGYGFETIARHLNEKGLLTDKKKEWNASLVSEAIQNEKNFGDCLLFKYYSEGFPSKAHRNKGRVRQVLLENTHDAIYSREDQEKIANLLIYRKKKYKCGTKQRKRYPFTSKLKCVYCGQSLKRRIKAKDQSYEKVIWVCCEHDKRASNCALLPVNEKEIEKAFVRMFNRLKINYEEIILPYLNNLNRLHLTVIEQKRINRINGEILEIQRQTQSLARCRAEQKIDAAFYYTKLGELERKRIGFNEQRAIICRQFADNLEIDKTKKILEIFENYEGIMEDFEIAIFTALVKRIRISNDQFVFELSNELKLIDQREGKI